MAKQNTQSRSEITDAAMGVRAGCVMLHKEPYIINALRILNDILAGMETHQHKKFSRLRALHQWPLELNNPQNVLDHKKISNIAGEFNTITTQGVANIQNS